MEVESVSHQFFFFRQPMMINMWCSHHEYFNNQNIREECVEWHTKGYVGVLLHALQACDTSYICVQCMLVVICNEVLHKVQMPNKFTF